MTGIIRIGVTERGSFKKYSEAVHIPFFKGCAKHKAAVTYSEFTMHMQNQLKSGSFVITKAGLPHYVQFFLLCTCYEMNCFEMTLLA